MKNSQKQSWNIIEVYLPVLLCCFFLRLVLIPEVHGDGDAYVGASGKNVKNSNSDTFNRRNIVDEFGINYELQNFRNKKQQTRPRFHFSSSPSSIAVAHESSSEEDDFGGNNTKKRNKNFYQVNQQNPQENPVSNQKRSAFLTALTYHITYIGCFATWEKQFTRLTIADSANPYDSSYTPSTCAEKCRRMEKKSGGTILQVIFLKGAECLCATVYGFNSSLLDDGHCNLPCPMESYDPSAGVTVNPRFSCGGNFGYSVYCISGTAGDCKRIMSKVKGQLAQSHLEGDSVTGKQALENNLSVHNVCSVCSGSSWCVRPHISPDFDYFPANRPSDCVHYCAENALFVRPHNPQSIRQKTSYAALMWWKSDSLLLPICRCLTDDVYEVFKSEEDLSKCNMSCPGQPNARCGGRGSPEKEVFATVYCIDHEKCGGGSHWTHGTSVPTTQSPPTIPDVSEDPCDNEDVDCDDEGTETESTTEFEVTTVTSTSTPISTPSGGNGTTITSVTETENESTERINTSTPLPISTSIPTTFKTSSKAPETPCSLKCKATDRHGFKWEACAGHTQFVFCGELNKNSTGSAFWKCSEKGSFEAPQPDVRNCISAWLQLKQEKVKEIKNVEQASDFIETVAEMSRSGLNSSNSSGSHYFGHEIRDITDLVDKVILRSREFSPTFTDFESLSMKAVDLNAFLIQYREPWRDLIPPEKSSVSTLLLENTENTILHLTQEVNDMERYRQIFTMRTTDIYRFLILAETFNKLDSHEDEIRYEFPRKHDRDKSDSFIKLPEGWYKLLQHDKVEIAAMSIDSEYVSFVMPGQFDNLISSTTFDLGDNDSKLINGKLISLTVTSSPANSTNGSIIVPNLNFQGKGVEITFHHDVEAWGGKTQNIPRRLHQGERPKAVLGSTKCVFWDMQTYSWSERGCRVVRRNRYETVCECEHLTAFAVLMDVHKYVGQELGLQLLTLILCPASEVALFISIIILSSVGGLQKTRAAITKNLSLCLLVGNLLVLFVLDRNYFDMSEDVCAGAAMVTHYVFLCAFMWMLIEGVQLYRMVVHVFDSGKSFLTHFAVFAYGSPLLIVAVTAITGYLRGDKPYGGDIYCWLTESYHWSFMGPVAVIILVNLVILFIALKTAYQLRQNKKASPPFLVGKIRACRNWFKGCFSLTIILGLTWTVGFFTVMKAPGGMVAAYIFTILNASQGLFIFFFNCVFNDKVRSFTRRNLSSYLPSWLTSSFSSNPVVGNNASIYGKRPLSPNNNSDAAESIVKESNNKVNRHPDVYPKNSKPPYIIGVGGHGQFNAVDVSVSQVDTSIHRYASNGTLSSLDSIPTSTTSENGQGQVASADNSQKALISQQGSTKID